MIIRKIIYANFCKLSFAEHPGEWLLQAELAELEAMR